MQEIKCPNCGEVIQLSFNSFGEWAVLTNKAVVPLEDVFSSREEAEAKLKEGKE